MRGCNSVLFKSISPDSKASTIFEGHIEDKCTQTIYIRLSKDCVDALNLVANMDLQVEVQFSLNRLPFCEWHRAVDSVSDIQLVFLDKMYMQMKETSVLDLLETEATAFRQSWDWLILNPLLNAEQKRAVAIMTASSKISLPPVLLLGPFGTGKTFTIAQALRVLLTKSREHKILLCTHSNSAADLYVKDFFDPWYKAEGCSRLKPVRIIYKGRAKNTVRFQGDSIADSPLGHSFRAYAISGAPGGPRIQSHEE